METRSTIIKTAFVITGAGLLACGQHVSPVSLTASGDNDDEFREIVEVTDVAYLGCGGTFNIILDDRVLVEDEAAGVCRQTFTGIGATVTCNEDCEVETCLPLNGGLANKATHFNHFIGGDTHVDTQHTDSQCVVNAAWAAGAWHSGVGGQVTIAGFGLGGTHFSPLQPDWQDHGADSFVVRCREEGPDCASDEDCDDGNLCSIDTCTELGRCEAQLVPAADYCGANGDDYSVVTCDAQGHASVSGCEGRCGKDVEWDRAFCCGGDVQECCPGDDPCDSGLVCDDLGICTAECGAVGQLCCDDQSCAPGAACNEGTCEPCGDVSERCCEGEDVDPCATVIDGNPLECHHDYCYPSVDGAACDVPCSDDPVSPTQAWTCPSGLSCGAVGMCQDGSGMETPTPCSEGMSEVEEPSGFCGNGILEADEECEPTADPLNCADECYCLLPSVNVANSAVCGQS